MKSIPTSALPAAIAYRSVRWEPFILTVNEPGAHQHRRVRGVFYLLSRHVEGALEPDAGARDPQDGAIFSLPLRSGAGHLSDGCACA